MKRWVQGMRDAFFASLYRLAERDKDIVLISSDTGAICLDRVKKDFPSQYVNVGIAEQNMVGIAAGMALAGKKVYIYAIVPFVTMRCYEQIRIDLCCMNLPVTVVGVGAGLDYSTLGPTHHGTEDIALMRSLPGMSIFSLSDSKAVDFVVRYCYELTGPKYVRIDRTGLPLVYGNGVCPDMKNGFSILKRGSDCYIVSTGRMTYTALQVAKRISRGAVNVGVIDLLRIKPFNYGKIWDTVKGAAGVLTLEEHFLTGGIGSIMAELFCRKKKTPSLKCLGIPDSFCRKYGTREYLLRYYGLDAAGIAVSLREWIGNGYSQNV